MYFREPLSALLPPVLGAASPESVSGCVLGWWEVSGFFRTRQSGNYYLTSSANLIVLLLGSTLSSSLIWKLVSLVVLANLLLALVVDLLVAHTVVVFCLLLVVSAAAPAVLGLATPPVTRAAPPRALKPLPRFEVRRELPEPEPSPVLALFFHSARRARRSLDEVLVLSESAARLLMADGRGRCGRGGRGVSGGEEERARRGVCFE